MRDVEWFLHFQRKSGRIWCRSPEGEVRTFDQPPAEFVGGHALDEVETVRLLGSPENAQLLAWLYDRQLRVDQKQSILLGTPAEISGISEPVQILNKFDTVYDLPRSLGGWREVTYHDYIVAMIQCVFQLRRFHHLPQLLPQHPAWMAVSFITTLDLRRAARFLAAVGDPRWYVSPLHPDRHSRLRAHLGLSENYIKDVLNQAGVNTATEDRCQSAVRAWLGQNPPGRATKAPGDFLRRHVNRFGQLTRGVMRATNLFVSFVRQVWLDNVTPHSNELFAPEHFFAFEGVNQPEMVAAFESHRRGICNGSNDLQGRKCDPDQTG